MDISVVIPVFNEEESLPELIDWIQKVCLAHQLDHEMILVDDGSRDQSWSVISDLSEKYSGVKGIKFGRNYGKSAALQVGFEAAKGAVVITMDADLQDSPDEIPALYNMVIEENYDMISGWKKKRFDPINKTIPSKFFNFITRLVSGIKNLHDFNCGLKAYKNEVVKSIEVYGEMHRYIPVIVKWAGYDKIGEKVVEHRARKYGTTKFGASRFVHGFLDLITITFTQRYLKKPMHFFGSWGAIFALIGGVNLLILVYIKFVLDQGITHRMPAIIFSAVMLILGVSLFSTGLLAELISRNSPYKNQYRITEKIKLKKENHTIDF